MCTFISAVLVIVEVCVVVWLVIAVVVAELVSVDAAVPVAVEVCVLVAVLECVVDTHASHIAGHASFTTITLVPDRIDEPHFPSRFLQPASSSLPEHRGAVVPVVVCDVVTVVEAVVVTVVVRVEQESQSPGQSFVKFITRPLNLNSRPHAS
jgi:hypothetical protein